VSFDQISSSVSPSPGPEPVIDPMDHIISLLSAYVNSIFPKTGIPGSAVVIVKDDKIIYMDCLGSSLILSENILQRTFH
jgi:hypothetical protein